MAQKRKFGRESLNSISAGEKVLNEAIEKATTTNQGGEEVTELVDPATPTSENVAIETQPSSAVQPQSVEASENVASAAPAAVERKPRRQKKTAARPSAEEEAEKTKLISVQVPMSLYRRLSAMKMDTDISLKDLSLQAIEELVKRNGY